MYLRVRMLKTINYKPTNDRSFSENVILWNYCLTDNLATHLPNILAFLGIIFAMIDSFTDNIS